MRARFAKGIKSCQERLNHGFSSGMTMQGVREAKALCLRYWDMMHWNRAG